MDLHHCMNLFKKMAKIKLFWICCLCRVEIKHRAACTHRNIN